MQHNVNVDFAREPIAWKERILVNKAVALAGDEYGRALTKHVVAKARGDLGKHGERVSDHRKGPETLFKTKRCT